MRHVRRCSISNPMCLRLNVSRTSKDIKSRQLIRDIKSRGGLGTPGDLAQRVPYEFDPPPTEFFNCML